MRLVTPVECVVLSLLATIVLPSRSDAQILALMPFENPSYAASGQPFREACIGLQTNSWPNVEAQTAYLGNADWAIDRLSDAEQQECFSIMRTKGIRLALEVGVLKEHCHTAAACFSGSLPALNRMVSNGAELGAFFLDEPLRSVRAGWIPGGTFNYAVNETRNYIDLIRQNFGNVTVVSIEPYPFVPESMLRDWITAMATGSPRPDYFEVDTDLNDPALNATELSGISWHASTYAQTMGFALLYSYSSNAYGDVPFYQGTDYQCSYFNSIYPPPGLRASLYHVSAFNWSPITTTPESYQYSFMGAVKNLLDRGCVAGGVRPGQPAPNRLLAGQSLNPNQWLYSPSGTFGLVYQGDGNLVVYQLSDGSVPWHSQTNGTSAGIAVMQGDGNFVVYDATWTPQFNTGTNGHDGAYLELHDGGFLVVYSHAGVPLWFAN